MPTVKKIADIKANLLHPALTSHFEVTIPKPTGLDLKYLSQNGVIYNQGKLNLLCSEAIDSPAIYFIQASKNLIGR